MKRPFAIAAALCIACSAALAQDEAPAPPAVPIGEVTEEPISRAAGQTIEGMATVIDGDELRVGDSLIRLFGIAAPDISSNLGPDARLYLQGLADGQHIICTEVDRNIEEQSIAICTIEGTDLATELLAQGLAAVYRVGAPPTPEELLESALPKWIEHAPLLGLMAVLGIIALALLARRREDAPDNGFDDQVLVAALLAEVSAIRDAALEQYDWTASLSPDRPIPGSHYGLLNLPGATVFAANADRLDALRADLATRLVRFYAMHDGVTHLLQQAATVPCDMVRASLHGLARSADEALAAKP
jgi:endonuclease YncB( thermonuclease family)